MHLLLFDVGDGDGVVDVAGVVGVGSVVMVVDLERVEGRNGDALRGHVWWRIDVWANTGSWGGVVGLGESFVENSSLELQPPHRPLRLQHLEHQLIIIKLNLLHLLTQLLVLVLVLLVFCTSCDTVHGGASFSLVSAFCC